MTKPSFIRAIEIWVPTADRTRLTLKTGHYGELDYFERISRGMQFAFDEGLPGKCWASGQPTMLKDLSNSYFKRGDAAMTVGLTCAVAVPHFIGPDLQAVTVLFCGGNAQQVGAIELWHAPAGEHQMSLADGYFGSAEKFEFTSRHTQFSRNVGLPGMVWDSAMPVIMDDLGRGDQFLRRDSAEKVGINRAIGFPVKVRGQDNWVLTFLSARNTPIARRFELWVPDEANGCFTFDAGFCEDNIDLASLHREAKIPLDAGPMGEARMTKVPVIASKNEVVGTVEKVGDADGQLVVLPVFVDRNYAAMLSFVI